ncbi:helix-turn-helix domain-containing protein [Leptospira sp. 96542]|nr:helix-turn-helix domain-containing protein [Leptospira sp. 96542]
MVSLGLLQIFEFLWLGSGGVFCIVWAIQYSLQNNKKEGYLLAFILISTGLWLLSGAFFFTSLYKIFPYITLFHIPFVLLSAPLLYLYLQFTLLEKQIRIRYYHFILAILSIVMLLPFYTSSEDTMVWILDVSTKSEYAYTVKFLNFGTKFSILVSVGLFIIRHWIPNVQMVTLIQKNAIYTFIFIILIWIDLLIGSFGYYLQMEFFRKLSALLLPILMYYYFFTRNFWSPFVYDIKDNIQKSKYEKSKLGGLDLEQIEKNLSLLMAEKIYCDEDLSLSRLASLVNVQPGQLSEYFHKIFGFGFYQFINRHRIEEAKTLLLESKFRSVLAIADSVGFNSKSTFNRVFLELVGKTPTEFRESQKQNHHSTNLKTSQS